MAITEIYSDRDLALGMKNNDSVSFERLYKKYSKKVYCFSLGYLKSESDAEEMMQSIFVKLWENRHDLQEDLSINSFIFTVTKNRILNVIRKRNNARNYVEYSKNHYDFDSAQTEESVNYNDLKARADQAIEELPPRRKQIYKLSREKGFTYKEIADEMGISIKTVENQMVSALKYLKQKIGNE